MCWACDHPNDTGEGCPGHIGTLIDRHGWAVQCVPGRRGRAPIAYTVGRVAHGRAELVVSGLPAGPAATLFIEVAGLFGPSCDPVPGRTIELPHRPPLEVVELRRPEAHRFVAVTGPGERPRALQLVWPDERGRWPWHPVFRGRQPVFGRRVSRANDISRRRRPSPAGPPPRSSP